MENLRHYYPLLEETTGESRARVISTSTYMKKMPPSGSSFALFEQVGDKYIS